MKAPSWVWENDRQAQFAFVEECIQVLEGEEKKITRAHVAACADWLLRENDENRKLRRRLVLMNKGIARLCRLAFTPNVNCFTRARSKTSS